MKKYGVIFLGIVSLFLFYKCSNEKENVNGQEMHGD